jgi:hypothetical protein
VTYSSRRGEWLAVIYRDVDGVRSVLTVGCEDTEVAAKVWALRTLELMNAHDDDAVEVPDKYDRRYAC